jgi:hypothetical protein
MIRSNPIREAADIVLQGESPGMPHSLIGSNDKYWFGGGGSRSTMSFRQLLIGGGAASAMP